MRPEHFYYFRYPMPGKKKPVKSTYRMTLQTAAQRLPPGYEPILESLQVIQVPETIEEQFQLTLGHLQVR